MQPLGARTGLDREQHPGMVAAAGAGGPVRDGEQSGNPLVAGELGGRARARGRVGGLG
jgi:hypothetical protein